uniref:C3H1-type domain-containing protein n=1 Tax=Pogona vitticeps TaxID=103695 RepID=A0ABM5GJG1_9SAUR
MSEQGHEIGDHDGSEGIPSEHLEKKGRKRNRTETTRSMEAGEGTSYGYDPYEDPATYTPEAADAARGEKRGEYGGLHNTSGQGVYWPWYDGRQQPTGSHNMGMSSPVPGPGHCWPQIAPQWFGWGTPGATSGKAGTTIEGREANLTLHPSVPNTGYNSAPFLYTPYTDYSTPLGDHLTPAIKERIWRGDYLDFYDLLNREYEVKELDKDDEKIKEKHRRKRPDRNWNNWVTGFTIYAGVLVKMQPWKASALFQYYDIMRRAKAEFEGQAWLRYDEAFRMRSAIRPELRWDEVHPGLWLQHMSPAKTNLGDRFDCGHLNIKFTGNVGTRQGAGQTVQPRLPCYEFNNKGSCSKSPCRFKHECITCGGKHPRSNCFRAGGQRQGKQGGSGRKPEGGGSSSGKGANANQN